MPIDVIIADDDELFRLVVKRLLEGERAFRVVGEAGGGEECMRLIRVLRPDAILLDMSMPGVDSLEATRRIKFEYPGMKVVILAPQEGDAYRAAAVRAGADAFLLKKDFRHELVSTLRAVRRGAERWKEGA